MTTDEVLRDLEAHGTAQNRKVYGRHGVGEKMFGVSYADLGALKKKIKTDHELAVRLWASGYHDARVLALMVADPQKLTSKLVDSWVRDLDSYVIVDPFARLVAESAMAADKAREWRQSPDEWVCSAGWSVLGFLSQGGSVADPKQTIALIAEIERTIHGAPNRVRHVMNDVLIGIGIHRPELREKAIAAAKRIGKVKVDHGETGCKTPDAVTYILKTLRHYEARPKKSAARGKK